MPKSVSEAVKTFYEKKKKFDSISKAFDKMKADFYKAMEAAGVESFELELHSEEDAEPKVISLKRIQNKSVTFDDEKLAKKLISLNIGLNAITKTHVITDYAGLVTYLKECGVDPKVFRGFVETWYSVDKDNIKQMYELGQLSLESLEGCFEVKLQKPYFKITD